MERVLHRKKGQETTTSLYKGLRDTDLDVLGGLQDKSIEAVKNHAVRYISPEALISELKRNISQAYKFGLKSGWEAALSEDDIVIKE